MSHCTFIKLKTLIPTGCSVHAYAYYISRQCTRIIIIIETLKRIWIQLSFKNIIPYFVHFTIYY